MQMSGRYVTGTLELLCVKYGHTLHGVKIVGLQSCKLVMRFEGWHVPAGGIGWRRRQGR